MKQIGRAKPLLASVEDALGFAGLPLEALSTGAHPDTGDAAWVLDATIQQYSAFLVALAVQYRTAGDMANIVDSVQIENKTNGDTLFWITDLSVPA